MPHIALVTEDRYTAAEAAADDWYLQNILDEDRLLSDALARHDLSAARVSWSDPAVDWSQFRCAVIRSTWDYFERFAEFAAWLDRVQQVTHVCNPPATLAWNVDKHYLADLEARSVRVVPSRFIELGDSARLAALLDETLWREAVVKPCISGGARHTYRVNHSNAKEIDARLAPLLGQESFLLQPFKQSIVQQGEDTLMMFGGRYTHAVRKRAKPGDFRVQDDHGGTVELYEPTAEQIDLAQRAMAACDELPVYGRVDMVEDAQGHAAVMELELVEPELWLRLHPEAAEVMAEELVRWLG
ncbi:ATP-grasp domain-containing protein [Aeoliella sp.]|uniref:ATP-grasp domain-containing protein n=1 Tax=Aeoliella sp. TaxID=2795800 RepID=UPI003CCBDC27